MKNNLNNQQDLQNNSQFQLTHNRSYHTKADDTGILYQDLSVIKRNHDESFGILEYETSHNQMKNNFKMKDHEDLSRLNNRKDTEMLSMDATTHRPINILNDLDKSPRIQSILPQKIDKYEGQMNQQQQISQQKMKDLKQNEDDDRFVTNTSSNQQFRQKTTQDLTNQQSNYFNIDYTKGSSFQKGLLNSEGIKNEGESIQVSSHNNLKLGISFRKNLNSEMSLNDKSPKNQTGNFLEVNQSKGNQPKVLNESLQMSGGQDTFRPNGVSQTFNNTNNIQTSFNKSKGLIQDFQSKTVATKKDLNTLLSNSRKIKLISKIKAKFCAFLGNNTVSGRTKLLNNNIRSQINDQADFLHKKSHKKFHSIILHVVEYLIEKFIHFTRLEKLPLFDPENPVKIIFNTIIVAYNCFFLYWMSIEVFFNAHVGDIGHYLGYTAQACWVTEMLIQMNTCTYHDNEYITDRKEIMVIYFEEYLFFEVVPLIFEGRKSNDITTNIFLHLPLLLKFKGMTIILKKLEFYVLQILKNHYFLQLFKLVMLLFLLAHIEACLYNVVGEVETSLLGRETNWIKENPINDGHWYNTYLTALFWSFSVLMNTTTKPTTEIEIVFTCLCMLFSCIFFGYTLNLIGNILIDIERQQKEYKRDLNILNQFMQRKNLSLSYRRQANISLQNFYTHNREKIKQEDEVMQKINPQLVQEILVAANKNFLSKYSLFSEQFSQETLEKIYTNLEEETYAPRQVIIGKNSNLEQQCIYFIASGKVNVFVNAEKRDIQLSSKNRQQKSKTKEDVCIKPQPQIQKPVGDQEKQSIVKKDSFDIVVNTYKKTVNTLTKGDVFGQYGFFTGMDNDHMVQSAYFTTVMKLKRSRFLEILKETPQEYERFCELKDKMLNEKEENLFFCHLCESNDHQSLECNKNFYNKLNPNFFFRVNYSFNQERVISHKRKIKRGNKTIINAHMLLEALNKIYEDEYLSFLIEQYCEELDQIQYSDSDSAEEEGDLSESLSVERSIEYEIDNHENLSQNTIRSGKSNFKSNINTVKNDYSFDDNHESLKSPLVSPLPYINNMVLHNNQQNHYDVLDSPLNKKKPMPGTINEEKSLHLDFEQRNQLDFNNPPNVRSLISNPNLRKLSAAKKSTFLSEQASFNTKEFDEHLNRIQDFMHNPHHLNQQADQQLHELLNQNFNKLKQLQDKYRSLYSHYVSAKKQLKSIKNENPAKQGYNGQKRETTMLLSMNEPSMFASTDNLDNNRKQLQGSPPAKSRFLEEMNGIIYSNQNNLIYNNTVKESMAELEGGGSKRYLQHKGTMVLDSLAQIQNFMWTFDKMKNYTKYFVESNIDKMIRKTNNFAFKNLRKMNIKKKDNVKMKQLISIKSDSRNNSVHIKPQKTEQDENRKKFEKQSSKFKIKSTKEQSITNQNK